MAATFHGHVLCFEKVRLKNDFKKISLPYILQIQRLLFKLHHLLYETHNLYFIDEIQKHHITPF